MNKIMFLLWLPDWGETEEDGREVLGDDDKEYVAEQYVKKNFHNMDYPESVDIAIKDNKGIITYYNVEVEAVPHFRAYQKKTK